MNTKVNRGRQLLQAGGMGSGALNLSAFQSADLDHLVGHYPSPEVPLPSLCALLFPSPLPEYASSVLVRVHVPSLPSAPAGLYPCLRK